MATGGNDLATAFLDALDERDGSALAASLSDGVAYDSGHAARIIGRNAVRDAMIERASALDEKHRDRLVLESAGGRRIAVETTLRGTYERDIQGLGRAGGEPYSISAIIVFEIDSSRISRVSRYFSMIDWQNALS